MGAGQDFLWWEQPFQIDPQAIAGSARRKRLGIRRSADSKAAGLETVETAEAKNTWFEILGQSLAVMARSIGALLHREVNSENGGEESRRPEPDRMGFGRD